MFNSDRMGFLRVFKTCSSLPEDLARAASRLGAQERTARPVRGPQPGLTKSKFRAKSLERSGHLKPRKSLSPACIFVPGQRGTLTIQLGDTEPRQVQAVGGGISPTHRLLPKFPVLSWVFWTGCHVWGLRANPSSSRSETGVGNGFVLGSSHSKEGGLSKVCMETRVPPLVNLQQRWPTRRLTLPPSPFSFQNTSLQDDRRGVGWVARTG